MLLYIYIDFKVGTWFRANNMNWNLIFCLFATLINQGQRISKKYNHVVNVAHITYCMIYNAIVQFVLAAWLSLSAMYDFALIF